MNDGAPPSLDTLDLESLKTIATFLTVPGLLALEKTCTIFRNQVLSDDKVWQLNNKKKDPRLGTFRALACVEQNLIYIHRQQRQTSNLLLNIFEDAEAEGTCVAWKQMIENILFQLLPEDCGMGPAPNQHCFFFRGDTMGTLMEILEVFLVTSLGRAREICVETCAQDNYPVVKASHLRLQEEVGKDTGSLCKHRQGGVDWCNCLCKTYSDEAVQTADSFIAVEKRDKMIRAAAFCAGITKLDNGVYDVLWTALVKLLRLIFESIYVKLEGCFPEDGAENIPEQKLIVPGESMRDYAPFPEFKSSTDSGIVLTPCPGQIEEAASCILPTLPIKIYNHWLKERDNTAEQEIAEAESKYDIRSPNNEDLDCPYVAEDFLDCPTVILDANSVDFEDDESMPEGVLGDEEEEFVQSDWEKALISDLRTAQASGASLH